MIFAGSAASPQQFPKDGLPEVAFLGRSNVGKSSLLNALVGRTGLARVSSTPGRTRIVNFFRVAEALYLADLPGYGYARVPEPMRRSWERLAVSYLVGRTPLAACVFLVDVRHEPSDGDQTLRAFRLEGRSYRKLADAIWLSGVELGLRLWDGRYEDLDSTWLRWVDEQGMPIPTGVERADHERQRAERLAEQLRRMGAVPEA